MNINNQQVAAKKFVNKWLGKGDEKSDSQKFWLFLLQDVYGVEDADQYISFERRVKLNNTKYIDGYIKKTKVLIEQKSIGIDLDKASHQSDSEELTPAKQAWRYIDALNDKERPKWIIISNFKTFRIYNLEKVSRAEMEMNENTTCDVVFLKDLEKEYHRLQFLVDENNDFVKRQEKASNDAAVLIGKLYDALLKQYDDKEDEKSLKDLNKLCVRLVFCFYAEDSGIFNKNQFYNYLKEFKPEQTREALHHLFNILNMDSNSKERKYLLPYEQFDYVNGGLFADDDKDGIEIPIITNEIYKIILNDCSEQFDWSEINPTIFGALFESTLNPDTRRKQGMHYTSIENIHKVIDPLFMDSLREELDRIKNISNDTTKKRRLEEFRDSLSQLCFLDPACGSGNFLTETYLSLRNMENEILSILQQEYAHGQVLIGVDGVSKVNINQFYGIEYNDFAVSVAKTALWIAEAQMKKETDKIISYLDPYLPLKTNANIVEGNALHINWESIVPKTKLKYIMGNPPFIGASEMSSEQKKDAVSIFGNIKLSNSIDYVGSWYHLAAKYIQGTNIKVAFVSTNSITQGEQVAPLWNKLVTDYSIEIKFAYKTFIWNNKAKGVAKVHCVIIGFGLKDDSKPIYWLYDKNGVRKSVKCINPYLKDSETNLIESRSKPICNVPLMYLGNKPTGDALIIKTEKEANDLINAYPSLKPYIKKYVCSKDLINGKIRYCLWLKDANPKDYNNCPEVRKRLESVKEFRSREKAPKPTKEMAKYPYLFFFTSHPNSRYIAVPGSTSGKREYLPIVFLDQDTVASNAFSIIPNAGLYEFGVISSKIHMIWLNNVCGRLKSDYRYSGSIVYNTFFWPNPTKEQKEKIEKAAQGVLDARLLFPGYTLKSLYDPLNMKPELRKAHEALDKAVEYAYGRKFKDESDIISYLLEEYMKRKDS